mgnify:CR=1 FL=1
MKEHFGRISYAQTKTTSNSNRNTNIDLSCQAINGYKVAPGDTFSFNQATGQRTAAKGYKEATAISGGQSVPEVGGGVCQTSFQRRGQGQSGDRGAQSPRVAQLLCQ